MPVIRCIVALLLPVLLFAHEGEPLQPHDLAESWIFPPGIVIPLVLSAWLYLTGASRVHGIRRWEAWCWWTGWVTLALSLISPIHPLGEALFSAHMVQHEILMVVSAPLLVLGRPIVPFLWALPEGWRRPVGSIGKNRAVRSVWDWMTLPGPATLIHGLTLWIWHAPPLFESTLTSDLSHSVQHVSFLGTALLFWWALFRRDTTGERPVRAVAYLFITTIHTSVLGALLTFASQLWYPAYGERAEPWGLTALQDQQLGGLIMWVPASLTYIAAGLALTVLVMRKADAQVLERESEYLRS